MPGDFSLYIHVPFCRGFCDYCGFYSELAPPGDTRVERYLDRLLLDGGQLFRRFKPRSVPSVYIGGGTPSVLGARGIGRLLRGVRELCAPCRESPVEITVEANPESADEAFLAACAEAGATRLSLGVQTFHEPSRRAVRRAGNAAELPSRLALAASFFPGAFSADLIAGLPFQDEAVLRRDIDTLLSFGGGHISLYALAVEEGTPLGDRARGGRAACGLPAPDEADALWLAGRDALEASGYRQYEVSNFCLPGKESLHNTRYWRMENWLALGPGASATIITAGEGEAARGLRVTVKPGVDNWLARPPGAPPPAEEEALSALTLMKETALMGFRLTDGPDEALFRARFGAGIEDTLPAAIAAWCRRRLLRPGKPALTKAGLLLLDRFLVDAFREMDRKWKVV
ncbi:MAG: coproporphyrinogen III oxidase HemN [Treponematales bacterium]